MFRTFIIASGTRCAGAARFARIAGSRIIGFRSAALRGILLAGAAAFAHAQPAVLPPEAIDQFEHVIGSRVEVATILGGDYGAAGGVYTFRGGNLADVSIGKIGGGGVVAPARPLGETGLRWAPVLQGNLGSISAENEFTTGYLQGNRSLYDVLAVQAGGGVRLHLSERLSLTPALSGIYGRTENTFKPQNAIGDFVQAAAGGTYVDWTVETWSVVPSLDFRYEFPWHRARFEFSSRYSFFHTESFRSTSPVVGVNGNSHLWENKLDADVPLNVTLFGRGLRTGGFLARMDMAGDAASGMRENQIYTVNGRLVVDLLGHAWKVRWIGIGFSYFWGANFDGWSGGLDLQFKF